jgi:hypothetical protein
MPYHPSLAMAGAICEIGCIYSHQPSSVTDRTGFGISDFTFHSVRGGPDFCGFAVCGVRCSVFFPLRTERPCGMRQPIVLHLGCTATDVDVMSKGLGAILSTGDSLSANSAGAADCSWSGDGTAPRCYRTTASPPPKTCALTGANLWLARWLLPDEMMELASSPTAGGLVRVLGPITCSGLQAQDRVLAHMLHFVHPALDPAGCARGSQLTTRDIRTPPSAQATHTHHTEPPNNVDTFFWSWSGVSLLRCLAPPQLFGPVSRSSGHSKQVPVSRSWPLAPGALARGPGRPRTPDRPDPSAEARPGGTCVLRVGSRAEGWRVQFQLFCFLIAHDRIIMPQ